ncbi:MAG: ATP-binding protein [Ideonella sp.]|nr:ATP-binding protein [Ideonella sp.]
MNLKLYRPSIARHAEPLLRSLARSFPVLVITGPRQSGKTTLAREVFSDLPYVNLEDPDVREQAILDPRLFFRRFPDGVVLDEVQRAPVLMSYMLGVADEAVRAGRFGRYVLTGSHQFGIMDGVTQSLAGRVGLVQLLPLSHAELRVAEEATAYEISLEQRIFEGGYPALHGPARPEQLPHWFSAYMATYLERDVRQMLNVGDLLLFQRFVCMCASRSGQTLNLNSLATDCGVSQPTARQWLTVLQASGLVALVGAFHRNFGKRLVKAPKLYFLDTGLLCHLLRLSDPSVLWAHALRGAIFETWVASEVLKHRANRGLPADLYHWRDNHGLEVDLVAEQDGHLVPVECKSGMTVQSDWFAPYRKWRSIAGANIDDLVLVYGGDVSYRGGDHHVLSWRDLGLSS